MLGYPLFFELWKRREKILAFSFGVLGNTQIEDERRNHNGKFQINDITGKVQKVSKFSTRARRLIVEIPFFLIGVGVVFWTAIAFQLLNDKIEDNNNNQQYEPLTYQILSMSAGSAQGLSIVILNTIYSIIVDKIVLWENHKYESQKRNSSVLKNVYFQFTSANISLFLFAFYHQDYERLYRNFVSVSISTNVFNIIKTTVLPLAFYKWNTRSFDKNWNIFRENEKKKVNDAFGINEQMTSFDDMIKAAPNKEEGIERVNKFIKFEKNFVLREQVERTHLMVDMTSNVDKLYMAILIQFSYVSIFHGVFPLSSLFIALANLITIFFNERMYSTVTRRSLSKQDETIGIWNQIFESVGLISVIISALIAVYSADSYRDWFDGDRGKALLFVLASEHAVLALRYLITVTVNDIPEYLVKRLKKVQKNREKYTEYKKNKKKEEKAKEEANNNQKSEKKKISNKLEMITEGDENQDNLNLSELMNTDIKIKEKSQAKIRVFDPDRFSEDFIDEAKEKKEEDQIDSSIIAIENRMKNLRINFEITSEQLNKDIHGLKLLLERGDETVIDNLDQFEDDLAMEAQDFQAQMEYSKFELELLRLKKEKFDKIKTLESQITGTKNIKTERANIRRKIEQEFSKQEEYLLIQLHELGEAKLKIHDNMMVCGLNGFFDEPEENKKQFNDKGSDDDSFFDASDVLSDNTFRKNYLIDTEVANVPILGQDHKEE